MPPAFLRDPWLKFTGHCSPQGVINLSGHQAAGPETATNGPLGVPFLTASLGLAWANPGLLYLLNFTLLAYGI